MKDTTHEVLKENYELFRCMYRYWMLQIETRKAYKGKKVEIQKLENQAEKNQLKCKLIIELYADIYNITDADAIEILES